MDDAACRGLDTDAFYPREENNKAAAERAIRVCKSCRVAEECFWYAVDLGDFHGVWGGLTGSERRSALKDPRVQKLLLARLAKQGAA